MLYCSASLADIIHSNTFMLRISISALAATSSYSPQSWKNVRKTFCKKPFDGATATCALRSAHAAALRKASRKVL